MNEPPHSESEELPESETPATKESEAQPVERGGRRWVKWTRRLVILLVLLGIAGFVVNGPVARWAVLHFLDKALVDQGMSGSAEVEGTILGGLEVRNLDYTGNQGIQELKIGAVVPDYTISGLLDSKLGGLKVETVQAKIDLAGFPEKSEPEEDPEKKLKETLAAIRPWIIQPDILIENLDVELVNGAEGVLTWQLKSLSHAPDSEKFQLNEWKVREASGLETPVQSVALSWYEQGASLDKLELLPDIAVSDLNVDWSAAVNGSAGLAIGQMKFEAVADDDLKLKLVDGKVVSEELLEMARKYGVELELDAQAVLSELDVQVANWQETAIPDWSINLDTTIDSGKYENYELSDVKVTLKQESQAYDLKINGLANSAPVELGLVGRWTDPGAEKWWKSTNVRVDLDAAANPELVKIIPNLPDGVNLNQTKIKLTADAEILALELGKVIADGEVSGLKVNEANLPMIDLQTNWDRANDGPIKLAAKLQQDDAAPLEMQGEYDLEKQTYLGAVSLNVDGLVNGVESDKVAWVNALLELVKSPLELQNDLAIVWTGSGNLEKNEHVGFAEVQKSTVVQPEMKDTLPVQMQLKANYRWPEEVNVEKFDLQQNELSTTAAFSWNGEVVELAKFDLLRNDELIGRANGKIPYKITIDSLQKFVAQTEPWMVTVDTEELSLQRISQLLPIKALEGASGVLQTKMNLTGSPSKPEVDGDFSVKNLQGIYDSELGPISVLLALKSDEGKLKLDGRMTEFGEERITIDVDLPFQPKEWLDDENLLETLKNSAQLKGKAKINKLPLGRLKKFVPQLEKIEGTVEGTALFEGTVAEPKYSLDFHADFPVINVKGIGVDDIKEVHIKGRVDESLILKTELRAEVNGGKFNADLVADVNDAKDPSFELKLMTEYALVFRNDLIATRANGNIMLKGKLTDATISGDVGIVESIVFKDMDLIPIGVPSSAVEAVKLPALKSKNAKKVAAIPEPFGGWKLNLTVRTQDPILLRGNVGKGRVVGSIKVGGTVSDPALNGTLFAKQVKAKLPFSILNVENGRIIFQPQNGLIPTLQVRGRSQVGNYSVNLNVYGSADSPKITFSSYPPLPEHEIMTLLATGTTNAGLENKDVATFKALQILLLELKDKSDQPGGNRLFKLLLSGIEDLDLRVGEVDDLTGEKFASATVKLHKRWFLTTQFDGSGQTRGLIVFALRFN